MKLIYFPSKIENDKVIILVLEILNYTDMLLAILNRTKRTF